MVRSAVVFGWGAVERHAETWAPGAHVVEVAPRIWAVYGPDDALLGLIGKGEWTPEGVAGIAEAAMRGEKTSVGVIPITYPK